MYLLIALPDVFTFEMKSSVISYNQVQFEDGSELSLKREDVWAECEQLPKTVASRLVNVTVGRPSFLLQF